MRDGLYWLPLTAGLLGIVWYRTSAFTSAGYQAPTSWNELTALTRRMIADGQTPWCIATNDPPSPGWAITDWLEALVLRTGGAELYDRWARHEVPFDDEAVRRAGRLLDDILFTPGSVLGGPADVIKKPGVQAIDAMAQNPPACLMSEGGDVTDYVGEADDYDYFVLPPVDPSIEPSTVLWGRGGRRAQRPTRGARARAILLSAELGNRGRRTFRRPLHAHPADAQRSSMRQPRRQSSHERPASARLPGGQGGPGQRELAVRSVGPDATGHETGLRSGHDRVRGIRRWEPRSHPRRSGPRLAHTLSRGEAALTAPQSPFVDAGNHSRAACSGVASDHGHDRCGWRSAGATRHGLLVLR
jgi:hypothetical protein